MALLSIIILGHKFRAYSQAKNDFSKFSLNVQMLTNIPDQQCGQSFFMNCDTDMDGRVREDEWSSCLGCQGETSRVECNHKILNKL